MPDQSGPQSSNDELSMQNIRIIPSSSADNFFRDWTADVYKIQRVKGLWVHQSVRHKADINASATTAQSNQK